MFFARPSAGAWHHYAIVMDTTAPAASQITPYIDGRAVSYQKLDSGTGAGRFANSILSFMSRNGTALLGKGDLDEVAIYDRALGAGTIADHFGSYGTNRRPSATFTASPNPAAAGQTVTLNASASSDPDGSVQAYEWDLDGNGTFERDAGPNPVITTTFAQEGDVQVRLRVIDDRQGTDIEAKTVTVTGRGPTASFTATPNPVTVGQAVGFDATGSTDPDGTIVRYQWDLDGDGTFETDTGTTRTTSRIYSATGDVSVKLRVTDDEGGISEATRAVTVVPTNQAPVADFTVSPIPANVGQAVNFDGSGSTDAGGSIVKYEWDLDGNGSYETDTGAVKTASRTYTTAGSVTVKLRVTDNDGLTAEASRTAFVNATPGDGGYAAAVAATSGLAHYWRLGELTGGTLADTAGSSPATTVGGVSLGAPGGTSGDTDRSVSFDGVDDAAVANLDLSGTNAVTLEFWLKWDAFADNDALAFEFTPNFNGQDGGFLVDPNSPQDNGRFGVAIGSGLSRNNAFFARPSAGAWHHYALVLDTFAPAASQITPYVDGQPVTYFKGASGTGAGSFANSQLYFMSRAASALFGAGDLDEVAIYERRLAPSEIVAHHAAGVNALPTASFTATPGTVDTGQAVSFNASASADSDGTIAKYEWDLDGNGSYETDTGTTATTTRTYAQAGVVTVGLRVTDNAGDSATTTRAVTVKQGPAASFTATPATAPTGTTIAFDAAGSADADGTITKYEWDLDGNGSYETDTGTVRTTSRIYAAAATIGVGLRVTDNDGKTNTTTRTVTITNRLPAASFTVSPTTVATRQTVNLNASASSDPDGTIAQYGWDFDGNGTYEVTGTAPTTTRVFDTPGTINVGLRVTDNNGGVATTTRALTVQSAYAQAVLGTTGLRGYWRLADTGTTAVDSSTSNNPGTYTNGPPIVGPLIAGEQNQAHDFDGTNDHVNLSPTPVGTPTSFSAEAWVRTGSTKSSGNYHYLITNAATDLNDGFTLAINSSNRAVFTVARNLGIVLRGQASSSATLQPNTTYHVVGTYDGNTVRVYVNGAQSGTAGYNSGVTWSSSRDLMLGRKVGTASQAQSYLDGILDEAAVYTSALSAGTVTAHWNAGRP